MEAILFMIGGRLYTWIEVLWRGYSHWTMFLLSGFCFIVMGILNEHCFPWKMNFLKQCLCSAIVITVFELITGCVVNLWLEWDIWDYSDVPFNLFGQICLPFFLIWIVLSAVGIVIDDWIRYILYLFLHNFFPKMEKREKPHYRLIIE